MKNPYYFQNKESLKIFPNAYYLMQIRLVEDKSFCRESIVQLSHKFDHKSESIILGIE